MRFFSDAAIDLAAREGHMTRQLLFTAAVASLLILASSSPARADERPASRDFTSDPFFAGAAQTIGSCSNAGSLKVIDGETQCVCRPGFTGRSCESCAAGFERGPGKTCVLGAAARRDVCYDKGTPYLDRSGGIACRCDKGKKGIDCGGPDIVIEGAARSIEAGKQVRLRAKGAKAPYTWELLTQRGTLVPVDGSSRTFVAPTDVERIEIVRVRVRDGSGKYAREFGLTLTPRRAAAVTGIPVSELASFDQAMTDYMKGRGIRAGVLAVAKDGQIVLSRGYGYMDKGVDADPFVHDEGGTGLVSPSTPMRLASVTKPITAAAVREALADEQLETSLAAMPWVDASLGDANTSLAELYFPYTPDGHPYYIETNTTNAYENCLDLPQDGTPDSRWNDITIQHLLAHEGGFDRGLSPSPRWNGLFAPPPSLSDTSYLATTSDPNFKPAMMMFDLATATGLDFSGPLRPKALVQYMAGLCLAFTPGTRDAYSNFGYTLLGRVLEGLHGEKWSPGNGVNRRYGWGPYIEIIDDFLAGHGITSGIRAGGTGSFSSENPDHITSDEPYYRYLNDDGSEPTYLNVGGTFGVAPNGDMYFGPPAGVPAPYGGFSMQTMEAHGGLVATAPALLKFMRQFRLAPSANYGDIGVPRESTTIGGASHSGLLPGTYTLAWQVAAGDKTYTVPLPLGAWSQTGAGTFVVSANTSCTLPPGIDIVALFSQSRDPKDHDVSEYGRISHFLGKAACEVATWPNPLGASTDFKMK